MLVPTAKTKPTINFAGQGRAEDPCTLLCHYGNQDGVSSKKIKHIYVCVCLLFYHKEESNYAFYRKMDGTGALYKKNKLDS